MFLSLGGSIIPNHGYVVISDISNTYYSNALLCHTNSYQLYYPDGDWFSPTNSTDIEGFYTGTSRFVLQLYRSNTGEQPINGIYHCTVRDDTLKYQTVYVGLYNSGSGELVLDARCSSSLASQFPSLAPPTNHTRMRTRGKIRLACKTNAVQYINTGFIVSILTT